jgi:hypothetical protein
MSPASRKAFINALQESLNRAFKPLTPERPKRLISARIVARRLDVSNVTFSRHIRRGLIAPDFVSDQGVLFRPERLPEIREALRKNRERNWKHTPRLAR